MAISKKEQARIDAQINGLREQAALRWPTEAEPQPMDVHMELASLRHKAQLERTGPLPDVIVGWAFHTYHGDFKVSQGCSTGSMHCDYKTERDRYGTGFTQGPGRFYRTERDAIIAARWAICRDAARTLAKLDAMLESLTP